MIFRAWFRIRSFFFISCLAFAFIFITSVDIIILQICQPKSEFPEDMDANCWNDYENLMTNFSNYEINVYSNIALVYHDIKFTGKYLGEEIEMHQKRVLHFVKIDGTWKIDFTAQLTIPVEKTGIEGEPETEDIE